MYQLFKGYVPTKEKKCQMPFKGKTSDELLSKQDADKFDEYAGILNDNTILIDVDDYDMSEIMMQIVEDKQLGCRVYKTTRGKHFLFLNDERYEKNWTKKSLACGLKSDGKLGSRTSYSVLKYNGKSRPIIYDINPGEEYDPVPKWMLPIRSNMDFLTMGEGDGRNQALFNYILRLQSNGFSKDEARDCITIINHYVLKKPLSEKELDTILRDDAFKKPVFYDGTTFLHDKFAQFLISEHGIIKIGNRLHYYNGNVYVPNTMEGIMIKHIPGLRINQRREVMGYLQAVIEQNTPVASANYIAFRNGIYDLSADTIEPFSRDRVITNLINWNYNPHAYSKLVDDTLNHLACGDHNTRLLLEEVIGYCFYRRNELRKAFMLKGRRHNGKSTFLDMLGYLLGETNISVLDLGDFSNDHKAIGLFGKLANLGDDIEDDFIPSAGTFKKIVSGEKINCDVKFEKAVEFAPYCKLIFSGNSIPRLGKGRDSDAIIDRLIIVPFNADFSKGKSDFSPWIKYDLRKEECMEYLVKLGIEGLKRVLENLSFTTTDSMNEALEEYAETLNPITTFFEEHGDRLMNEASDKCYRLYDSFCYQNALKPLSRIEFTKQVKEYYGCEVKVMRVEGKSTRVFVRKGDVK